jgi:hypothetical protein
MTPREFAKATGYTVHWIREKILTGKLLARDMRRPGRRKAVWKIFDSQVGKFHKKVRASQRNAIRNALETAASTDTWLTLRELRGLTTFGEASISAQMRHLRKPCYGGYVVLKRYAGFSRGWEYRIRTTNTEIHNDTKTLDAHA